ncbi:TIGR04219 family outer membrane beta-barrel protein [Marinobacter sp. JSM 1782161]|uniref:TIGR04219 family outer membrane beta-barrel protein n=1 Tax=Marinobacter sp. JSM 1782161 TaxID=2685906 RepID=UPI001403163D|nr:TIGR04219 family outer membrane beta-barrel protein [Marinobacter sp. JSM 1782161]
MRKFTFALLGGMTCFSSAALADVVGLGANVSYWDSDLTGTASQGNDTVDVDDDLNLDSDDNVNLTAILEHPVPLLPNVRLNYTSIEQSGRGRLSTNYNGIIVGSEVRSELDLDQVDLTLYYELLDNWVNLDGGLTVRNLDGKLTVRDTTNTANVSETEVDAVIPMLYAAARFDLPLTGLSVGVEGSGIAYGGDSILDGSAYGQYDLSVLRLRAGYREYSIDYEDGDDALDVEIGGPFISAGLDF